MRLAPLRPPNRALVRGVAESYARLYGPMSLAGAHEQHANYVAALETAGVQVTHLPAEESQPDGHFVEDAAIVIGDSALETHPGRVDRRGETASVAAALRAAGLTVESVTPPACIEGGDVLRMGRRVFVGHSRRTNPAGEEALRRFCERRGLRLEPVSKVAGLHLKSGCSGCAEDTVLVAPALVDPTAFTPLRVLLVPPDETYAANVLALGQRVLLPAGHLHTAELLDQAGLAVTLLPMECFRQGDGALTCLSILWED